MGLGVACIGHACSRQHVSHTTEGSSLILILILIYNQIQSPLFISASLHMKASLKAQLQSLAIILLPQVCQHVGDILPVVGICTLLLLTRPARCHHTVPALLSTTVTIFASLES